jgi:hypothetical protein
MTFRTTRGKIIKQYSAEWWDVRGGRAFERGAIKQAEHCWARAQCLFRKAAEKVNPKEAMRFFQHVHLANTDLSYARTKRL